MKLPTLFSILIIGTLLLVESPVFASESTHLEAPGSDMRVTLKDRVTAGVRPVTALEPGSAGRVHVEYFTMPDEQWQEVRWIVRFPLKGWEGKQAASANFTCLLYAVQGDRQHRVKVEAIGGAQGKEIMPEDRAMAASSFVEVEPPDQLPAEMVVDVTDMLNEAIQSGQSYLALRLSITSDLDYPGVEIAGQFYFSGRSNPEEWTRNDLPTLDIVWRP